MAADERGANDSASVHNLAGALHRLAALARRHTQERLYAEPWVGDLGFRPPCIGVMECIARLQPVSQKAVSERLGVDPSDLVGVVDILERAGFVERRRDPHDRRRHSLVLTAAGRRARRRLEGVVDDVAAATLAPLDADEQARFRTYLGRILAHQLDGAPADPNTGKGEPAPPPRGRTRPRQRPVRPA
jgi:DNA-binding MarR family transcriptional regulator